MLRKNMKAYVDEMLVNLVKGDLYTTDLRETFECMSVFALIWQSVSLWSN